MITNYKTTTPMQEFKIESWAALLGVILGGIVSFIAPVAPFLAIALALIIFDLYTGIRAAKKKGIPITSSGLKRTIEKITLYFGVILVLEGVKKVFFSGFEGTYVSWVADMPITYVGALTIVLTELKSAAENLKFVSGVDIWGSISKYFKFNNNDTNNNQGN